MLGHVSSQNQINDSLAYELERVAVQILEDVHPFIRHCQFETKSSMVIFQDTKGPFIYYVSTFPGFVDHKKCGCESKSQVVVFLPLSPI